MQNLCEILRGGIAKRKGSSDSGEPTSEAYSDKGSWYTGNTLPWHGRIAGPIPAESTLALVEF
jgi:hypothetical protein